MLIDTHAHLDMEQFGDDLPETLKRAQDAGVGRIITIGSTLSSSVAASRLADKYEPVFFAPGFHPHDAGDVGDADYGPLRDLALMPKAVAVGETGLDYHYDLSPRETQREHFARQIRLAREVKKPLVVHSREAEKDTLDILLSEKAGEAGGTMHCFSGSYEAARAALDMGLHISVGGTLTFKNAHALRDVIRRLPVERVLLETDCPYLAPQPYRGRRNEPAFIRAVADTLAGLMGLSVEDVERITALSATALFGLGGLPSKGVIAYPIRDSLYLNITNRCTNRCTFCVRNTTDFVKGHNLRLREDPALEDILSAMSGFERYDEVVFCGYGEPFLRLDVIKEVAARVKAAGIRVRVNTNGHASLIHGRDVLPELAGLVDALSVSLNFPTAGQYREFCRPSGDNAYEELKKFVVRAREFVPDVSVTVLDLPGVDIAECRRVAEEELGVRLRVRRHDTAG